MKIKRPVLRYHGGKWKLAPWIIGNFPSHRIYVEPYGGGASVLLRKEPCYCEVYNDLDKEVVNLFEVLRSADAPRLIEELRLTPFAREEFVLAYKKTDDPVERARRTVIKSFMGFGSAAITGAALTAEKPTTGFRANSNKSGTTPAKDWINYPESLALVVERLRGLVIENRPAVQVMKAHDGKETLHYVDPPYVHSTRSTGNNHGRNGEYRFEMTDAEHEELATTLHGLEGMVVLSGYPCELYNGLYRNWQRIDKSAHADGARDRIECLWLNPAAAKSGQGTLEVA